MKDLNPLINTLKSIHLTEEERKAGRNALLQFMDKNPKITHASLWERLFMRTHRPLIASGVTLALLLASTGGVTYASETTLPGDFLYPFKVNVVEEITGALYFTPEGKTEWQIERMERRFEEAEILKNTGKLNPEIEANLTAQLTQYSNSIQNNLKTLEASGDFSQEIEQLESDLEHVISSFLDQSMENIIVDFSEVEFIDTAQVEEDLNSLSTGISEVMGDIAEDIESGIEQTVSSIEDPEETDAASDEADINTSDSEVDVKGESPLERRHLKPGV